LLLQYITFIPKTVNGFYSNIAKISMVHNMLSQDEKDEVAKSFLHNEKNTCLCKIFFYLKATKTRKKTVCYTFSNASWQAWSLSLPTLRSRIQKQKTSSRRGLLKL